MDTQVLTEILYNLFSGNGKIADNVYLNVDEALNLSITHHNDAIYVKFVEPIPTVTITKLIAISAKLYYVKIDKNGKMYARVNLWPFEVEIKI